MYQTLCFLLQNWLSELVYLLQPMLQELAKQNPHLLRLIQEHHAEFLQLINEPVEGVEGLVCNVGWEILIIVR